MSGSAVTEQDVYAALWFIRQSVMCLNQTNTSLLNDAGVIYRQSHMIKNLLVENKLHIYFNTLRAVYPHCDGRFFIKV